MMDKTSRPFFGTLTGSLLILFSLTACKSPMPKCIGDTWSYNENVQTNIDIDPDLTIEINREGGWGYCPHTLCNHGDGSVDIFLNIEASQTNIQIEKDQLQQIVSAFEEANFFGVSYSPDCGENYIEIKDAGYTNISVETHGKIHAIQDKGGCAYYHFDKYCASGARVRRSRA